MKKVFWIILLIIVIVGIVLGIKFIKPRTETSSNTDAFNKNSSTEIVNENGDKEYQKTELDDGVLYSLTGKKEKSDVKIPDNYFDTTINDMYLNSDNYKDKKIEVEGLYFENLPYTFVGRYSESNLCPNCPNGYSFIEYQLDGKLDYKFTDAKEWIKVIGMLEKGNDETSNYEDYYYLKVISLEIMNEKGQETVNN